MPEAEQEAYYKADDAVKTATLAKAKEDIAKKAEDEAKAASEVPAPIQKRLDDIQKDLDDERTKRVAAEAVAKRETEARQLQDLTKRADTEFSALPGTGVAKGAVLASLAKLSDEERTEVEKLLLAGNAALLQVTKATGSDAVSKSGDGSAWSKIEKKADAMVTAGTAKTKAIAVDKVCETEPELYAAYLAAGPSKPILGE